MARLPRRGPPPQPGPQPQPPGAWGPQARRPGLLGAPQPGGARLHLPAAQHRRHPARMYSRQPARRALALPLLTQRGRIEWGGRSKGTQVPGGEGQRDPEEYQVAGSPRAGQKEKETATSRTPGPSPRFCPTSGPPLASEAPCPRRGWQGVGEALGEAWAGGRKGGDLRPHASQHGWMRGAGSEQCQRQALCVCVMGS